MDPKREREFEIEDPFKDMKIDNWMILEDVSERQPCLICKKSRKYFCYNCYIPVQDLQGHVPKIKLPIKIDIIKHSREIDGKSTAAHAAVLSPEDVNIYTYPCIPDYDPHERVVLVFPGKNAATIDNLFDSAWKPGGNSAEPCPKRLNAGAKLPITRAVFIDSTWNQSRGIYKDQRLRELPCVVLQSRISQFWRHQNGSPRWYLATVEAIHQFLVELHTTAWNKNSRHHFTKTSAVPASVYECSKIQDVSTCAVNSSMKNVNKEIIDESIKESSNNALEHDSLCGTSTEIHNREEGNNHDCLKSEHNKMNDSLEHFGPYKGEYDNLLFFFRYMYSKIHKLYDHEDLRAYKRPLK